MGFDMNDYQKRYTKKKQACYNAFKWLRENDVKLVEKLYNALPAKLQEELDAAFPEEE